MLIEGSFCDCEGEEPISQGRCAEEVSMVFESELRWQYYELTRASDKVAVYASAEPQVVARARIQVEGSSRRCLWHCRPLAQ